MSGMETWIKPEQKARGSDLETGKILLLSLFSLTKGPERRSCFGGTFVTFGPLLSSTGPPVKSEK